MDAMNDDQLVRELRDGSTVAFEQVVAIYQRRVVNICFRFVHDASDAEDLAQETFVEVYRSIGSFREQAGLATWIHRIAVRKSLDFLRAQRRQKRGGMLRAILRLDDQDTDIPGPTATQPDAMLEQKERLRVLRTALDKLPKNQRVAFVLSKLDGVSSQEIAGILDTSLSSVDALIHRAKLNLQKHLRTYYGAKYSE